MNDNKAISYLFKKTASYNSQQGLANQVSVLHMKIEELLKENQKLRYTKPGEENTMRDSAIYRQKNPSPERNPQDE
jgi:hypothetical protein